MGPGGTGPLQLLRPWDHRWIGPSQLLGSVRQCNFMFILLAGNGYILTYLPPPATEGRVVGRCGELSRAGFRQTRPTARNDEAAKLGTNIR